MAEYVLGSGDLYLIVSETIPEDAQIETTENKVGHISGGASLNYSNTIYEVVDDYNAVLGRHITKEEVSFKSGILTWDLAVLNKIVASSTYTPGTTGEPKTPDKLKIGGQSNNGLKSIVIRFVHTLTDGKKLKVTMMGNNTTGFELAFKKDQETIIDAEFKALSQEDGTLVEVTMEK